MAIFKKNEKIGCVFLKEESDTSERIRRLEALPASPEIEKQIRLLKYGEAGEKAVCYELQHSGLDMYVLHDLYLESGEDTAQIDFLLIMRNAIVVLECKNLFGNITIDNQGAFMRSYALSGRTIKEGIYSPVTQNERHMRVIRSLRLAETTGAIQRWRIKNGFKELYHSFVILANPKTCLNMRYAPAEIKHHVLRGDQIVAKLRLIAGQSDAISFSNAEMRQLADFFLKKSHPNPHDYVEQFEKKAAAEQHEEETGKRICTLCGAEMVLRTAKKGQFAGQTFWGCTNFPKCRNIEQCAAYDTANAQRGETGKS